MFTGIVERTARIVALEDRPGRRVVTAEMRAEAPYSDWLPAVLGESVSVNGACLTVVARSPRPRGEAVSFDAVPETLSKTTLGDLRMGDRVNIERSLRAGDRFGGHYVTGHVDGVGRIRSRKPEGDQVVFEVEASAGILAQMLPKGSVAVDGISLTLVDVRRSEGWFSFAVIPHTLRWTVLEHRAVGSRVNVETDAFGKWVLHALELAAGGEADPARESRLRELLQAGGFMEGGS